MKKPALTWGEVSSWEAWTTWLYQEVAPYVANHFEAGGLIAARLIGLTAVGDEVYVGAARGVVPELLERLPAIFIVPGDSEAVPDDDPFGIAQFSDQSWLVFVAVRNVAEAKYGQAALDEAGIVVTQVLEALQGWPPAAGYRPLRRTETRLPILYESGKILVPLQFTTRIYREGSINDQES